MDAEQFERLIKTLTDLNEQMKSVKLAMEAFNEAYRQEHGQARYE